MSINATNYMSSSAIEFWMEQKTEDLYGNMRDAMSVSNNRADAEQALNEIKADILNLQKSGGDTTELQAKLHDTLKEYKDVPELVTVLQPIADDLDHRVAAANLKATTPPPPVVGNGVTNRSASWSGNNSWGGSITSNGNGTVSATPQPAPRTPDPVKLTKEDSDTWTKEIGDTVDGLGKQDQLGLINIQEFNSQINQTKQIASALMDAADKAANAIISHIA